MAGHSPNNDMDHTRMIETWMSDCVRNGGIERYDELHVDHIDEAWRAPGAWLSASLETLRLATSIRDSAGYRELSVAVALSLQPTPQRKGVDFTTQGELEERLDRTAPSLYLFRRGKEPWTQPEVEGVTVQKIDVNIFGPALGPNQCYYMEFKASGEDEYYRSVSLTG
jgi:hypothetical protein